MSNFLKKQQVFTLVRTYDETATAMFLILFGKSNECNYKPQSRLIEIYSIIQNQCKLNQITSQNKAT